MTLFLIKESVHRGLVSTSHLLLSEKDTGGCIINEDLEIVVTFLRKIWYKHGV